jgi:hypothetical protein
MKALIDSLYDVYYPTRIPQLSKEVERSVISKNIARYTTGQIATNDTLKIMLQITIGGNFSLAYNHQDYKTFNIQSLMPTNARYKIVLKVGSIELKLLSDLCEVVSFSELNEYEHELQLKISPEFREHINILETHVLRIYGGDRVDRHICTDGIIKLIINNHAITRLGAGIFRTETGEKLNMTEHIHAGDMIKFVYGITLFVRHNKRVELMLKKIIKLNHITPFNVSAKSPESNNSNDNIPFNISAKSFESNDNNDTNDNNDNNNINNNNNNGNYNNTNDNNDNDTLNDIEYIE